jgi:hypothetical protein
VLGQIFKDCGDITKILPTGMAQPTKRFAFVTFATNEMALKAVKMNGMVVVGDFLFCVFDRCDICAVYHQC